MLKLNFSVSDLFEEAAIEKTRRSSISGVQYKVQLKRQRCGFSIVASGGDYILKPVPYNTYAQVSIDFIELGNLFSVDSDEVKSLLSLFEKKHKEVENAIKASFLSTEAQERYLEKFYDRIRAIKQ